MVERCLQSSAAFDFYLGQFIWPSCLMPIYPVPSRFTVWALPFLVGLAGLGVAGWKLRGRSWARVGLLGFGFFGITVLPVLGLADMTYLKFSWVADHLVYLPMIGLLGLSICGVELLSGRLPRAGHHLVVAVVLIVAAFMAWNARTYAARFADEQQMWAYNIALNPSAWAARNNLGCALLRSGRSTIALTQFDAALRLNPDAADAHANRGLVLMQTGQYAESIAEFETALRLHPGHKAAQENLQIARTKAGRGQF
jgi:tetratricopeptide (TPR) repeat protein